MSPKATIAATSEAVDDYLKAMFELSGPNEIRVSSNALAQHLGVRAASVTGMLQKLAAQSPSYVDYEKHRGARLSSQGKRRALEILRHHRLLERFLHDVLGYSWDEVHSEAERLEHFISEQFEERIAAKLGDPDVDPHGHPIPHLDGTMRVRRELLLTELRMGVPAIVSSVSDRDPAMLRYLERVGVLPRTTLVVVEKRPFDGPRLVRIGDRRETIRLSRKIACEVAVVVS